MRTLSGIYATRPLKLKDKMDEICTNGMFSVQPSKWRVFCTPVCNFTVFSLEPRLVPVVLELGQVMLF